MEKKVTNTLSSRDQRMYSMRCDGHRLEDIAKLFNVSRATAGRGVTRHRQIVDARMKLAEEKKGIV